MSNKKEKILEVKTSDYSLTFEQIGDMMSEFFGCVLTGDDNAGVLEFEFTEEENVPKAAHALKPLYINKDQHF